MAAPKGKVTCSARRFLPKTFQCYSSHRPLTQPSLGEKDHPSKLPERTGHGFRRFLWSDLSAASSGIDAMRRGYSACKVERASTRSRWAHVFSSKAHQGVKFEPFLSATDWPLKRHYAYQEQHHPLSAVISKSLICNRDYPVGKRRGKSPVPPLTASRLTYFGRQ
jgi:hypothetical protein